MSDVVADPLNDAEPQIAMGREPGSSSGILTVNLRALIGNYRTLTRIAEGAEVAGVVKADGYGLGALVVAKALSRSGCRTFFVAHLTEGVALRGLPNDCRIFVLNGLASGTEPLCAEAGLVPVLNSFEQLRAWSSEGRRRGRRLPAALQIDSGMSRFGLSQAEIRRVRSDPSALDGIEIVVVMSHLACADEADHPANAHQLERFKTLSGTLPRGRRSLANSAGIFLDDRYRFDLVRPGIALYGGKPFAGLAPNPMQAVARLQARVIQIRDVPTGAGIGYGHTVVATRPMRLATIGIGYADGWPRRLSNRIAAFAGDATLPMVGRVSMDSIILDAGDADIQPDDLVDLIGQRQSVDDVAQAADTIPYEILTSLGHRFERRYVDAAAGVLQ